MKKSIIVNNKEYTMPKMDVDTYLNYLEVRDSIMGTEEKTGLYTREQFEQMMDSICEMYGNQFTVEELKDPETGLSVPDIVMEFASIETEVVDKVNGKAKKLKENFQSGN